MLKNSFPASPELKLKVKENTNAGKYSVAQKGTKNYQLRMQMVFSLNLF